MLEKLSGLRELDEKMKRHILGGIDCKKQCYKDCGDSTLVQTNQDGDSDGTTVNPWPYED